MCAHTDLFQVQMLLWSWNGRDNEDLPWQRPRGKRRVLCLSRDESRLCARCVNEGGLERFARRAYCPPCVHYARSVVLKLCCSEGDGGRTNDNQSVPRVGTGTYRRLLPHMVQARPIGEADSALRPSSAWSPGQRWSAKTPLFAQKARRHGHSILSATLALPLLSLLLSSWTVRSFINRGCTHSLFYSATSSVPPVLVSSSPATRSTHHVRSGGLLVLSPSRSPCRISHLVAPPPTPR